MSKNPTKTLLVFGGNGFIGAECVETILDTFGADEYRLILVNRGNWDDWDTRERIKSRIHENIILDRGDDEESLTRTSLNEYLTRDGFEFDAVIDFSGLKRKHVRKALQDIPPQKIKLYIYISTDSVYEVSIQKSADKSEELFETDSVRPECEGERKKLKKLDSYAHDKLKCEELLIEKAKNKFPYVILRLPDVLGERDSSNRFWQLQMQLEYLEYLNPNQTHTIEISRPFYELKTSYVNVEDVAKMIVYLLKSDSIKNDIFNIGFDTPITLIDFYKLLAKIVKPGLENRLGFIPTDKKIYHPFPSVTRGPISIRKLQSMIGYQPSNSIENVFAQCIRFNRDAFFRYPKMRCLVEKELKKDLDLTTKSDKENFENFIRDYKM